MAIFTSSVKAISDRLAEAGRQAALNAQNHMPPTAANGGTALPPGLYGGAGDDTYINPGMQNVVELANEGIDTVSSNITYSLAAIANVENLVLTGSAALNGTGNELNNVLLGNLGDNLLTGAAGNDTLTGGGALSQDTLVGGAGDDVYLLKIFGDVLTLRLPDIRESAGGGTDTVVSDISYYDLPDNVENLTLTGNAPLEGCGNGLNNVITGNAGNNNLYGAGGIDTLAGGAGDDTYLYMRNVVIIENPGEGIDTVLTRQPASLEHMANVENLTLQNNEDPTLPAPDIDGTGNSGANLITGNSGNNRINGRGGSDQFDLRAGGRDVLVFDADVLASSHAVITGFGADDSIALPLGTHPSQMRVATANADGTPGFTTYIKFSGALVGPVPVDFDIQLIGYGGTVVWT